MIIVTGGAGFIGSNLVEALNHRGRHDIVVVDNLQNGNKFKNLADLKICDYIDKEDFINGIRGAFFSIQRPEVIFHLGACSDTTQWDGRYMMRNNFTFSKKLFEFSRKGAIPFIYASSAAVYGSSAVFKEDPEFERPLNVYGYSKLLFDQVVRLSLLPESAQAVGLRFFNVYGPRESHKKKMASVAFHFRNQNKASGIIRLFKGSDGYPDGGQRRDFVHVSDAVAVALWFWDHPEVSGIFNVGAGCSQTFNEVADAVISHCGFGRREYIDFPDHLAGKYQSFTQADLNRLRSAGCDIRFKTIAQAVPDYLNWMDVNQIDP
jgi:ADP-L-glycero-D-manno-heptose 6-epimerase